MTRDYSEEANLEKSALFTGELAMRSWTNSTAKLTYSFCFQFGGALMVLEG
jgi:hypothetical protein